MTAEVTARYTTELATLPDDAWNSVLASFRDASVYQTRAYAESRGRARSCEHLVVRRDGAPVAAAQVEIVERLRGRAGLARVFWGPVWKPNDMPADPANLEGALRALEDAYARDRSMVVRVVPRETSDSGVADQLARAGWQRRSGSYRTVVLDLRASPNELRRGLHQNWRRNLAKGEKAGLEVTSRTDDAAFDVFLGLYREMRARKTFESSIDPATLRIVQQRLPDDWKPRIFTASKDGVPLAAIMCSLQGDTGIYLFGASADAALPLRASYVAHWHAIEWLVAHGAAAYDLGGANPANAGTYQFKSGTGGAHVEFAGEFERAESRMSLVAVHAAEALRNGLLGVGRRLQRRLSR